jgi:hypothetical protein
MKKPPSESLLDGEPSGKAGSLCKPFLRALILFFTSVCKMWVRIRASAVGSRHPGTCASSRQVLKRSAKTCRFSFLQLMCVPGKT